VARNQDTINEETGIHSSAGRKVASKRIQPFFATNSIKLFHSWEIKVNHFTNRATHQNITTANGASNAAS
jgi:hypothetical protein